MKFYRIKKTLPVGVKVNMTWRPDRSGWTERLIEEFMGTTKAASYESSDPIELVLEIPEERAATVAKVLQEMADELAAEIVGRR